MSTTQKVSPIHPSGTVALVTGGASGIGRAIGLRLARDGADVALLDRNAAGAREVASEITASGRRALALEADVTSASSVQTAVDSTHTQLGAVRILVCAAGIAAFEPFLQMTEESFAHMIDVHLMGCFRAARAVAPEMVAAGNGRIVLVASVAGLNGGGAGLASYAAAKGGIIALAKALAHEFGPSGVTVNSIAPGLIDTPLIRPAGAPTDLYDRVVKATPVRRIGQPEDVAEICAMLVSPGAGFTTGQVVSPNGGGYM